MRPAKSAYQGDDRLSLNAGRLYKHFGKAFNDFAARNKRNLAADTTPMAMRESMDDDGRMALPIAKYTEEEYNNFGWARANDILTAGENMHYREQFAGADKLDDKYRMTPDGEYMIPVSDIYDAVWKDVERKIVFAKGTIDDPIITRVIIIYPLDESRIRESMEEIYAIENTGIQTKAGFLFEVYASSNFRGTYASNRTLQKSAGYNDEFRAIRRASGGRPARVTPFLRNSQNSHYPVRAEFEDISGVRRAVVEYKKGEYTVFDSRVRRVFPTIEEAILAEDENIIKGYAREYQKTEKGVIKELRKDPDLLIRARKSNKRFALPDTTEAVGKTKKRYEPSKKEAFFTAKDRAYIEAVDELYGIEKYLHKVGGTDKATVAARVQMARSARSQAQTMIGTAQFNVFSDKPEKMGDGLLEIYKPTRLWSQEKRRKFDDYLLHCLNIDRMTLEARSKVWTATFSVQRKKTQKSFKTS